MTYLTLDPSFRAYGWALFKKEKLIACGCIKTKDTLTDAESLSLLFTKLSDITKSHTINEIIFEDPVGSKSNRAAQALAYAKAITISLAVSNNIPFSCIRAKEVKKLLTNNSDAEKEEIYNSVCQSIKNFTTLTSDWSKIDLYAASDAAAVYLASKLKHRGSNVKGNNL